MKKLIPVVLLGFAACTQEPVNVVFKGSDFFGRGGNAPAQRIALRGKSDDSYIQFNEEPATMPAKVEGVGVSELPPLAPAVKTGPQSGLTTSPVQVASTVTGAAVSSKPSALGVRQPVPVMTSAIRVESPNSLSEVDEAWYQGKVVMAKNPLTTAVGVADIPGFMWPVRGKVISHFGPKANGLHNDGINIAAEAGAPVAAAADGVVVYAGNDLKGYGNMVIVRHNNGWMSAYAHADRLLVTESAKVTQGQKIATVGKSGSVEKAQLHFGLRQGKSPVDPMRYLSSDFAAAAH